MTETFNPQANTVFCRKYKQDLPPGKYGVYVQLNIPVSYARSKTNVWVGKILSNLIEFEIK